MGKITGFMEFERLEEGYRPVPERLKNHKEFIIGLGITEALRDHTSRRLRLTGRGEVARINEKSRRSGINEERGR